MSAGEPKEKKPGRTGRRGSDESQAIEYLGRVVARAFTPGPGDNRGNMVAATHRLAEEVGQVALRIQCGDLAAAIERAGSDIRSGLETLAEAVRAAAGGEDDL